MIQIAFYKAKYGNWVDKLISIFTFSKYSHCEIVFNKTIFASASIRDGGVRFKHIDPSDHWDVFDLKIPISYSMDNLIFNWFKSIEGQKYDYAGAIGSGLGLNWCTLNKKFCSYCCAYVFDLDPIVTPGSLFSKLKKQNLI